MNLPTNLPIIPTNLQTTRGNKRTNLEVLNITTNHHKRRARTGLTLECLIVS